MDVNTRIEDQLKSHEVLLYMKGTPDFPQCGFSGQTVAALKAVGKVLTLAEGVDTAIRSLDSGAALRVLDRLRDLRAG